MKKTRNTYTKEFKISIIRELENDTSPGELSRRYNIHPSLPSRWKKEYYKDPKHSFNGRGKTHKLEARNAELERIVGQLYAENNFLKKAISNLEKSKTEEKRLVKLRENI